MGSKGSPLGGGPGGSAPWPYFSVPPPHRPVTFLTDFADEAVVLPLVLVVAAVLLALGWRRGAVAWAASVTGLLVVMLVAKLAAIACGPPGLHSPSGHTAVAALFGGGGAVLALRQRRPFVVWLAALAAAGAIGLTRLALGMHSLAEVLAGGAAGVLAAAVLERLAGVRPPELRLRWLAVAAVVVVSLLHGERLPVEARIRAAALDGAGALGLCRRSDRLSTKADPSRFGSVPDSRGEAWPRRD